MAEDMTKITLSIGLFLPGPYPQFMVRQEKTRSMTDADGADAERGEPAKHWPVLTSADKC